MKKIILPLLLFLASCMSTAELRENKSAFPLGSKVEYEGQVLGMHMKLKGKVAGYNKDGTIRVLTPSAYLSENGRLYFLDTVLTPMSIKAYDLHSIDLK